MWPFKAKVAPDRKIADEPIQPETVYLSSGYGVQIVKWNDYIAAEAALSHPVIYRALNRIAESVQIVKWFAEVDPDAAPADRNGKASVVRDLNAMLHDPSPDMTAAQLRYWMALNYATIGRVPFKIGFSAVEKKRPNGIYPLEAKYVNAIVNGRGSVDAYTYGLTTETLQRWPSRQARELGDGQAFVSQVWKPGLRGYQHRNESNSPLQAVGLPARVLRMLLIRAIQTAEGHPNARYLVTCSKTLSIKQKEALINYIEDHAPDGVEAGRIPILQNAGDVVIHKLDNDLSDIHTKTPSDDMARIIFGAFGIPIALAGIGASDGAKFAGNFAESRQSLYQDTIVPGYIQPIFQGLTQALCPPGVRISPDLDSVPALLPARISSMKELEFVTFLTDNEKREMMGFEEIDPALLPDRLGDENTDSRQPTPGATNAPEGATAQTENLPDE